MLNNGTGHKNHWKTNNLYKAVVIPKLKNKFIVVQYAKNYGTGKNLTFPGGGCGRSRNTSCARKELKEETRNSIKATTVKYLNTVTTKFRTKKELNNNNSPKPNRRTGVKRKYSRAVTTHYDIYGLTLNNKNTINKIKKRYHSFLIPRANKKAYTETNNINSISFNNMNKPNTRMWWLMKKLLFSAKSKTIQNYLHSR